MGLIRRRPIASHIDPQNNRKKVEGLHFHKGP